MNFINNYSLLHPAHQGLPLQHPLLRLVGVVTLSVHEENLLHICHEKRPEPDVLLGRKVKNTAKKNVQHITWIVKIITLLAEEMARKRWDKSTIQGYVRDIEPPVMAWVDSGNLCSNVQ